MNTYTEDRVSEAAQPGAAKAREPDAYTVSIVMPCLNEAESLAPCIEKAQDAMAKAGVPGEVIVADNGSTDGSQRAGRVAGRARGATSRRKGYGSALQGGFAAARGKYILMGDADGSYDFSAPGPLPREARRRATIW